MKILTLISIGLATIFSQSISGQSLSVSENGRHLVDEEGIAFFWLGDTAWELFHRLDFEESKLYLNTRKEQGFTVIQAVVLAELYGLDEPNANGDLPLENKDPTRPVEAYFEHVDDVVALAESLGLRMALLPMWGDKWNLKWGVGPEVFTTENARSYGQFLGERYKDRKVIWILGGDRNPEEDEDIQITNELAKGIKEGDGGRHLMSYHPQGGFSSSQFFHNEDWLDFNMYQSGHAPSIFPNYKQTVSDLELKPQKPTLDSEPMYEDHPIDWKPEKGWYDEFDTRRAGYWSMLKGAFGHTYGNHNIWQMWQPERNPISSAHTPWREALRWPGAFQAGYMRAFFESFDWVSLKPLPKGLVEGPDEEGKDVLGAADSGFKTVVIYAPFGSDFTLRIPFEEEIRYSVEWYNPRDGERIYGSDVAVSAVGHSFNPPGNETRGNDWLAYLKRK